MSEPAEWRDAATDELFVMVPKDEWERLRQENERLRRELHGFICEECLKPLGVSRE